MLTEREQAAMECITMYMSEHGFAPSVRDMAAEMFVSHKTAHRYLEQLESKGRIRRHRHRPRAIQLI